MVITSPRPRHRRGPCSSRDVPPASGTRPRLPRAARVGELERAGCRVLELDVTDERSRAAAVRRVEAEHGAVGVLVNNAGHGGGGPGEGGPLGIVRGTFETQVFAVIRLCRLVLPGMRAQRSGLIVNIGPAAGLVTPPTGCPYA